MEQEKLINDAVMAAGAAKMKYEDFVADISLRIEEVKVYCDMLFSFWGGGDDKGLAAMVKANPDALCYALSALGTLVNALERRCQDEQRACNN